ncbi:mandelate racemase/muconate lactonizing enzyme family protein [Halobellus rufus]|uniref:mandelate racemase/muconate lactonizing enzyme family protein n=1 Tax=Halobellus rufus TaxID=1448860 RepID=UPI0006793392|nr:o-succinylbenzoate synthase [Halobellus rufus]
MQYERFSLGLTSPLSTARGDVDRRDGFLIRVERDGVVGLGESTPLPGWTESIDECEAALSDWSRERAADRAALPDSPAARHGIELALADADARAADEPLAAILSDGPSADVVPMNATVGDGSVEVTASATREAVESGYRAVKVKVGAREPDVDADRLRAARDAAGEDVELRADANGAWDVPTAERLLDVAADLDFAYVEQPLGAADLDGHAALRGRGVGVALDESLARSGADEVLAAEAADVLVCKPMALGGPRQTLDVARRASERGVDVVVTTTVDAVVARVGAVHVAAALPDVSACGLATGSILAADLAPDPAPIEGGAIRVPSGPGIAGEAFDALRRER